MAQYDPAKRYTWTPEDTFTLTGAEFGLFLNTVRAYLSSEEAARFQLMMQANQVIEKVMVSGVEANIIKEVVEEAPIEEVSSKDL
jgi:hypothetical protein